MDWPVGRLRGPRFLELGLFPPRVANHISLDTYAKGDGLMIGDVVTVRRRLLPTIEGALVSTASLLQPFRDHGGHWGISGVMVRSEGKDRYFRISRVRLAHRPTEYRGYWKALLEKRIEELRARARNDPLHPRSEDGASGADGLFSHDAWVSFGDGQMVAYSGLDDRLAQEFFRWTIIQADHLLDRMGNEPLPAGLSEAGLSYRRGDELKTRRARAFAAALLGEPLETGCLRDSARHWADECADVPPAHWGGMHKLKLIRATMWAMIAGDLDYAGELLASKRSFRLHQDHRQLLRKMVRKTVPPHADREFVDRCRTFFDLIRHPRVDCYRETHDTTTTAFEWAALMAKFIDRPGEEIEWRSVVDAVSR